MTAAQSLLLVLQEEATALAGRDFDRAAALTPRKEALTRAVTGEGASEAELEAIVSQADRNAEKLRTTLTAVRGLKARLRELGRAEAAVGYGEDGARLSCEDGSGKRRV